MDSNNSNIYKKGLTDREKMSTIVISYQGNEDHYQHYHTTKISLLTLLDTTFQAVIQRFISNTGQTKQ